MTKRIFSKSTNGMEAAIGAGVRTMATTRRECNSSERKRTRNVAVKQSAIQDESAHDTEAESADAKNEDRKLDEILAKFKQARAPFDKSVERALDILGYMLQDEVPVPKPPQPSAQSSVEFRPIVVDAKSA